MWYTANVPKTLDFVDKIGVDQHDSNPNVLATSLKSAQRGDELILSTITLDLLYAAVPHEPTLGPITTPLIISHYCLGRLGEAQ